MSNWVNGKKTEASKEHNLLGYMHCEFQDKYTNIHIGIHPQF